MKYECTNCGYATKHKSTFDRHNESKKHQMKSGALHKQKDEIEELKKDNDYVCPNCGEIYAHLSSLYKHQKKGTCKPKNVENQKDLNNQGLNSQDLLKNIEEKNKIILALYDEKFEFLLKDNQKKDEKLAEKDERIEEIIAEKEYFQSQYVESNKAFQQTVDFIAKNIMPYKIGLEQPIDYSVLHDEENDMKLLDELRYHYEKDSLTDYFVDLLVQFYHKDDPRQQAVHNTDAPRVNYIIVIHDTIYDKNNKEKRITTWKRDKGGIMFGKAGLDALFANLNEYLKKKIQKSCWQIEKLVSKGKDTSKEMARNMLVCNIQKKIQDESFKHEIIKKACPHFAFDREKFEQKLLELK
ncbi:MAG: hypothetical protein Edafosvirus21_19 [Edafosvirus sp.]|uniref:C2H2-type domain-containing protein n=1 Tax=Edafosvirus sp. TaxID=2487765 RepID=A0A3G4ZUU9_9VIRU|nr:MAG: hypothetical protein Edafosvirus21_19 [Edafosvirus sp.]